MKPTEVVLKTDAFSSGQVGSKLWLCEKLTDVCRNLRPDLAAGAGEGETIWIYGGWQGVLGLMLLSRPEFKNVKIRSFDLDPACELVANTICENWVWRKWQFRAFTADCDLLDPSQGGGEYGERPGIVINTSVEHFDRRDWFEKIPAGTLVALQASDFEHDGATSLFKSVEQMREAFSLEKVEFSGTLAFDYQTWSFNRLMLIGIK